MRVFHHQSQKIKLFGSKYLSKKILHFLLLVTMIRIMVTSGVPQISKHPLSPRIEKRVYKIFVDSIKNTRSSIEIVGFLNDLLTGTEKIMLAKRVAVAFLLIKGDYDYRKISKILRVSLGTVARVHAVLALQGEGYRKVLTSMLRKESLKNALGELTEILTPLPPKGVNWGEWKKQRLRAKWKREKPL